MKCKKTLKRINFTTSHKLSKQSSFFIFLSNHNKAIYCTIEHALRMLHINLHPEKGINFTFCGFRNKLINYNAE